MDFWENLWGTIWFFFWTFAIISYFFALFGVIVDLFRSGSSAAGRRRCGLSRCSSFRSSPC